MHRFLRKENCMDYYEINTFDELYKWLSCLEENGIKEWHADRESNDMFTLDGGRSGHICICDQKGGVCFEFLSGNETVMRDHFSYAEAYGVCQKAMSEWKRQIIKQKLRSSPEFFFNRGNFVFESIYGNLINQDCF